MSSDNVESTARNGQTPEPSDDKPKGDGPKDDGPKAPSIPKAKKKKKKPASTKARSKESGKKKSQTDKNPSGKKARKGGSKKASGTNGMTRSKGGGAKSGGKPSRKVARDSRGEAADAVSDGDNGFAGRLRRWSSASPLAKMMDRKERSAAKVLDTPKVLKRRREPKPFWPSVDMEAFGAWSERFARFMGTPKFLVQMTVFVVAWLAWNTLAPKVWQFDPRSLNYTLLTLILSLQASYAAPLILLAQNRQDDRDRVALEQDRQQAQRALADTEYMAREVASLRLAVSDLATRDYLRSELREVLDEVRQLTEALQDQADDCDVDSIPGPTSNVASPNAADNKGRSPEDSSKTAGSQSGAFGYDQPDTLDTPQLRTHSEAKGFFDNDVNNSSNPKEALDP